MFYSISDLRNIYDQIHMLCGHNLGQNFNTEIENTHISNKKWPIFLIVWGKLNIPPSKAKEMCQFKKMGVSIFLLI